MAAGQARIDYDALVKADRIHGNVYTDPAIFEEEDGQDFSPGLGVCRPCW